MPAVKAVVLCPVHQIALQDGGAGAAKALAGLGELFHDRHPDLLRRRERGAPFGNSTRVIGEVLPHPLSILRRLWPDISVEPERWLVSSTRLTVNAC